MEQNSEVSLYRYLFDYSYRALSKRNLKAFYQRQWLIWHEWFYRKPWHCTAFIVNVLKSLCPHSSTWRVEIINPSLRYTSTCMHIADTCTIVSLSLYLNMFITCLVGWYRETQNLWLQYFLYPCHLKQTFPTILTL